MSWAGAGWLVVMLPVLVAGCADAAPARRAEPVFCYRTIGHPECHPAPLSGEHRRLITVGPKYP